MNICPCRVVRKDRYTKNNWRI